MSIEDDGWDDLKALETSLFDLEDVVEAEFERLSTIKADDGLLLEYWYWELKRELLSTMDQCTTTDKDNVFPEAIAFDIERPLQFTTRYNGYVLRIQVEHTEKLGRVYKLRTDPCLKRVDQEFEAMTTHNNNFSMVEFIKEKVWPELKRLTTM
ncbi:uncharacterized protein VTP21DRAFT_1946 [Calcarisporiella thermophila]|uniref:uncharacterized protein n=1 Tax=Calcarisporiella thermophila TaxID=911321 RepID=UPI003742DA55